MSYKLLMPGDLVICRPDSQLSGLIAWSTYRGSIDDDVGVIDTNELMVVIESKKPSKKELSNPFDPLTKEWKMGAYRVISTSGINGWIGAGWVIPVR